jgi:NAD+ diphosphatase
VKVSDINYLGSQPWPFPQSLMIAFQAIIEDPQNARPDGQEIVEIRWYNRDELYAAIIEGTLLLPPSISVARAMIQSWYGSDRVELPGSETWR